MGGLPRHTCQVEETQTVTPAPVPHGRPTVEPRWLHTDWAALSEHLHFLPFLFLCSHGEEKLGSTTIISIAQLSLCSKSFCRKEWNWLEED